MMRSGFCYKKNILVLAVTVLVISLISPAYAYYMGDNWSTDGYIKSQFGVFTDTKPFNKARFGGSDDNISTARQMFRWNLNGQLSKDLSLRAEVLAIWEPEYPGEKGVVFSSGPIPANYYNSFDWRELTIEYNPSYSHSIKFGRQIINWGEALSGRVIDQCNPDDSRAASGFVGLEERYMPLWMFRGQHDFYDFYSTSFEWIVAPIWQADRYEHSRGVTGATPVGDGKTTDASDLTSTGSFLNQPSARWAAKRDNRINRVFGATMSINLYGYPGFVLGAPYNTGYHGSDLLASYTPGDPIEPLTAAQVITEVGVSDPRLVMQYPNERYVIYTEFPTFLPYDYTDHNFKNSRWGFKTKSKIGEFIGGLAFFQGPSHSPVLTIKGYIPDYTSTRRGYIKYQYVYPRYNTYGLYGNYAVWGTQFWLEAAYQPDRNYSKDIKGIGFGTASPGVVNPSVLAQRLNSLGEYDKLVTLWGVTREQNIPFLNRFTPFSITLQYTNTYFLDDDIEDTVTVASYFSKNKQMTHSFALSASTSYAYNKYSPGLTLVWCPEGTGVVSLSFGYVPEGFNTRLKFNANVTNYWTVNEFSGPYSPYDDNDSVTVGFQYSFY